MNEPMRVLVLDDDANQRKTLGDILKIKGYTPILCATGKDALERTREQELAIALIDLQLEDMSGLDVLRGIKKYSPQTECILLAGHASQDSAIAAINAGAYSYFQKPFDIEQLALSIQRAGEKRAVEAAERAHNQQIALLYEAGQRLNRSLDLDEIYQTVHDFLATAFPCDGLVISAFDSLSGLITCRAMWIDGIRQNVSAFPAIPLESEGKGTQSVAIHGGQSFLIDDYPARMETAQTSYYVSERGDLLNEAPADTDITRSAMVAPLKLAGQVAGVIQVFSYHLNAYTESQLKILDALALHIASAQQNALLYRQAQDEVKERKWADQALIQSEERYRSLVELSPDAIFIEREDGTIVFVNQACLKLLGASAPEQILGRKMMEIIHPDYRSMVAKRFQAALKNKEVRLPLLEEKYIRLDGSSVDAEVAATSFMYEGKVQVQVIARDISERKRAEEALRESEERFRVIFENANDAIHIDNDIDEILSVNSRACEMMGYSREELLKMHVSDLQAPEERQTGGVIKKELAQHGTTIFEGVNLHSSGRRIPVEISIGTIELPSENMYISIVRDISERKQAEAELHASQEAEIHYSERLTILSETTTELSKAENLDALCRRAVELGRERFDFDRLSIFFLSEDSSQILGTFGVDTEGHITDERGDHYLTVSEIQPIIKSQVPLVRLTDVPLSLKGQDVGLGMHVLAGLWDGNTAIGYLTVDNLLRKRPFSDSDCEIIRLYASALGHLCSLKRAQEEIRASQERFAKSFHSNPIATILALLPEEQIVDANQAFLNLIGYSREEVIGNTSLEVGYWKDPDTRRRLEASLMAHEPVWEVEGEFLTKSGETRHILTSAETIMITGQPHALIMFIDITERKRAEEELADVKTTLEAAFEQTPVPMVMVSMPDGVLRIVNNVCRDFLGMMDEPTPVGQRLADFNPSYQDYDAQGILTPLAEAPLARALAGQRTLNQERRVVTKDGIAHWALVSANPIYNANGNLIAAYMIMPDISERKQAGEALERERLLLRSLIDNAPDYIYVKDLEGRNIMANLASAHRTGLDTPEEMLGKTDYDYFPQELADMYTADDQAVIRSGQPLLQHEEPTTDADGNLQWISTNKVPLRDGQGNIYGLVGMGRDITGRRQAEEKLSRQAKEIARLYRASGSLISSSLLNVTELSQKIIEVVQQEFGQANSSLLLVQRDVNEMVRLAIAGPYADQVKDKTLTLDGPGLVARAIRMGETINVPDVHSVPGYIQNWEAAQSELAIPLKIGAEVIGAIDVQSSEPGAFSQDDERLMSIFAERAALALEHSRLNTQTDARMQQLLALRTIDMAISSSFDITLTLGILLDQITRLLGIHAVDILSFNTTTQTFKFACERGFRVQALQRTQIKFGTGFAWRTVRQRQMIVIPDVRMEPEGLQRTPDLADEKFISYIGIPLLAKGQVKGVLEVFHRETLVLEKEWNDFLEMLAGQAAIAIDNSELFDHLQSSNAELSMAYDSTLEGWAAALELRDEETEGHTRRVAELATRLAQSLGVKENDLLQIYRGALLHDIGKMGVPDSIVLKPGPLTEAEWAIMRRHPQYAYDMLSPITYLRTALDIPYCHHEKWDGTGYPRGLVGGQIPIVARIFAIVDVWDALTSDRPYRKAWDKEKTSQYIQAQAGLHFDPEVVNAFLDPSFTRE